MLPSASREKITPCMFYAPMKQWATPRPSVLRRPALLATNKMKVVEGTFGRSGFAKANSMTASCPTASQWAAELTQETKTALIRSVAIDSTTFETEDRGKSGFIGSKTETALPWLVALVWTLDPGPVVNKPIHLSYNTG
ncbi:hypothetical protein GGS20DRAFT_329329 [Poronia punctata]|nr:hypothetical protein GGS20DRAFT_329329 [Poronia punctata]